MANIKKTAVPNDTGPRLRRPLAASDADPSASNLSEAGRSMGEAGGPARAASLTPKERTAIAKQGGRARQGDA